MRARASHSVMVDQRSTNAIVENTCRDTMSLASVEEGTIEPYPTVLWVTSEK